ncbi:MAG: rod shape-determining protein MreD [Nitrospinaceae bacterium]
MFFVIQILLILVLFSVQTTLLQFFSFAGVTPDLALIFVVFSAIQFRGNLGIGMGFMVGLIQDCLSGGLLGANTLSKSLVAFFFSTLKDKIIVEGFLPIFLFIITASLMDGLIGYLVLVTLLKGAIPGKFLISTLPVYAVYNALVGPVLFYILGGIRKWILDKFPNHYIRSS